jgi:hypothetical protein
MVTEHCVNTCVFQSGGELENDERIANVIYGLVTLTDRLDSTVQEDGYKRISGMLQMVTQKVPHL